ncbi:MAG TPA: DEAD/DEAH box helicase, partial [Pyrodictiaceae archaeon]|nr:DEAD/DEAH box helicase [Pyrodictiaceae archaeon]
MVTLDEYNELEQIREIRAFQALVERDVEKLRENYYKNNASTRLKISEIEDILKSKGLKADSIKSIIDRWVAKGLIIDYGDGSYRTIYGELIYRLAHIAIKPGPSLPLVFHVGTMSRKLPNFSDPDYCFPDFCKRRSLEVEKLFIKTIGFQATKILFKALRRIKRYKGLSLWQFNCLKKILEDYRSGKLSNKVYVLMAPVSSGKTLVFALASIAFALKSILFGGKRPVAIFVYPRRSLATDQLRRLWELTYRVNEVLFEEGYSDRVMIGIDDGATPRRVKDPTEFRCGCPHGDKNPVIVNDGYVVCRYGEHKEILATKEKVWEKKPHILLTNLWIIHQGLMDYERRELFDNAMFYVFDEIHEYYDDRAAHLAYVVNRIVDARRRNKLQLPAFVASSATIAQDPNKVKRFIENRFQG